MGKATRAELNDVSPRAGHGGRLFRNMRLAQEHADALAAFDTRPPEYVFTTVEVKVLRAAINFLRKMAALS